MPRPSINDTDTSTNNRFVNKLFKPGVNFQFINTKLPETRAVILPAIPEAAEGEPYRLDEFLPYRNEEGKFTRWAERHFCVSRFGPDQNHTICSPLTFDLDAYCPLSALRKTASSYPDFCELAGLGPDGKKHPTDREFFKRSIVTTVDEMTVFNAMLLEGERAMQPVVLQTKKTVLGSMPRKEDQTPWGLIGLLERRLPDRFVDPNAAWNEFDKVYEVGDITNPDALAPIRIFRQEQTKGGIAMYNAGLVTDSQKRPVPTVLATDEMLLGRRYLPDIFVELEKVELFDLIFALFEDYPKLLRLAYSTKIPNIDSRLKKEGIVERPDVVRQVGGRRDVATVSAAVTHTATAEDDAPDADAGDDIDVSPRQPAAPATAKFAPRVPAGVNPDRIVTTRPAARTPAPVIAKPAAFAPTAGANSNGNGAAPTARRSAAAPVAAVTLDGTAGDAAAADILAKLDEEDAKQQALANG